MVLVIDNHDSFTFNLVHLLAGQGANVRVVASDAIAVGDVAALGPTHVVISPGPRTPAEAGVSVAVVARYAGVVPILGVCLGHQAIGHAFGGRVVRARRVMHGRTSLVAHDGRGVFAGLAGGRPFRAMRYHSLVVERASLPDCLEVTAVSDDGEVMGVRHRTEAAVEGVQFHPESFLSEAGEAIAASFLAMRASTARRRRTSRRSEVLDA